MKTVVTGVWDTVKTTATTAWNNVCTNVKTAVSNAKAGIQEKWTAISTSISSAWTAFKTTASNSWTSITGSVSSAVSGAKDGIVKAWDSIKVGVKSTWDGVVAIFKDPINTVSAWLSEKVEWFKGLFNFQWKLPEFKLPKIEVKWKDIGWGISLPTLSVKWNALGGLFDKPTIFATNAGLQGVGEKGPEAILPLDTLWDEMSARLKAGMREILMDMKGAKEARQNQFIQAITAALTSPKNSESAGTSVQVTQHIYAKETSYVGQQREAARNFRQIARTMA